MNDNIKNTVMLLIFALISSWAAGRAEAAIVVNIGSITLAPNALGTVDITISSDIDDPLQFYSFDLLITRSGGSTLQFIDPQSESHLGETQYVFGIDSIGGNFSIVGTTNYSNDTLTAASDFTDSGNDFDIPAPSMPPTLLYRLDLQHFEDALNPGQLGDTFTISVTGSSFYISTEGPPDPPTYTPTFNSGTVTIASASAIPEPSSLALIMIGGVTAMGWRRRRLRIEQLASR